MRETQDISTGSMADIAFLLLIFFLVTTTMNQDYGIRTNISKYHAAPDSIEIFQSVLLVNRSGNYLLNDEHVSIINLCSQMAEGFDDAKATKNVVLVKSEREVSYQDFLNALNETKKAFKLFHNTISEAEHNLPYNSLSDSKKRSILKQHPVALAEDVMVMEDF